MPASVATVPAKPGCVVTSSIRLPACQTRRPSRSASMYCWPVLGLIADRPDPSRRCYPQLIGELEDVLRDEPRLLLLHVVRRIRDGRAAHIVGGLAPALQHRGVRRWSAPSPE